ncbi:MAG: hypothetical protein M1828_001950 [Chrysothrix sp. TS-e1954]|nr:MAG: hypothetical protein M1828_001950 [Chrysothrix sp. TS-e1954]
MSLGDFPSPTNATSHGMDSLADELAGISDDDAAEDGDTNHEVTHGSRGSLSLPNGINGDSAHGGLPSPISPTRTKSYSKKQTGRRKHSRTISAYEGSEYGEVSDGDTTSSTGFSRELTTLMADIETLAAASTVPQPPSDPIRNGHHSPNFSRPFSPSNTRHPPHTPPPPPPPPPPLSPTYSDQVTRVTKSLTTLSNRTSQQTLETLTTTLISTEKSLSSYLRSETRQLQTNAHFLFLPRPGLSALDPTTIDEILALIDSTLASTPAASLALPLQLAEIATASDETRDALKTLADSLHMSLQTEAAVARRLRACMEIAETMRREYEACEVGVEVLRKKQRDIGVGECGRECGEIVRGFEEVCETWRGQLLREAGEVGG